MNLSCKGSVINQESAQFEIPKEETKDDTPREKVLIIGSGIMGINSAYFLAKDGRYDVTVIEKDNPIKGATEKNGNAITFGLCEPSTALPLWEVIKEKLTFHPNPSHYFRFSLIFDKQFRFWFWNYLKSRNKECIRKSHQALIKLGSTSADLFDGFIKDCTANNLDIVDYHNENMTFTFTGCSDHEIKEMEKHVEFLQEYEKGTQIIPPGKFDADFAYRVPMKCINSARFVDYMKLRLSDKYGVTFIQGEIKAITCTEAHVKAVEYADRMARVKKIDDFDKCIVCAGIGSIEIGKMLGLKVPIMGFKGHSFDMYVKDRDVIEESYIHMPEKICISRVGYNTNGLVRISGYVDLDGNNLEPIPWRKDMLIQLAKKYVSEKDYDESKAGHWVGLRPVTADDVPLIGKSCRFNNLFWNTGHGARGVTQSVSSASLLYSVISGEDLHERLTATDYDPGRFNI
ncbi:unnamed protein product [Moneuplotes crassus]|uniref:FAD dependent oxidoreductase domain-containing protein n=1 Tax=Euplotes crassus TaxID=5936 RepID=A0AAD1UH65_EUPCR|nr:unnamed protein product [Moneuplotes crassus]